MNNYPKLDILCLAIISEEVEANRASNTFQARKYNLSIAEGFLISGYLIKYNVIQSTQIMELKIYFRKKHEGHWL